MTPMQPRSRRAERSVTNTPRRWAKTPSLGILSGRRARETASTTACRANRSRFWRSASERDSILGFLAALEQAKLSALLDAVVELSPEAQEILGGRNQGAGNDQPQQKQSE